MRADRIHEAPILIIPRIPPGRRVTPPPGEHRVYVCDVGRAAARGSLSSFFSLFFQGVGGVSLTLMSPVTA